MLGHQFDEIIFRSKGACRSTRGKTLARTYIGNPTALLKLKKYRTKSPADHCLAWTTLLEPHEKKEAAVGVAARRQGRQASEEAAIARVIQTVGIALCESIETPTRPPKKMKNG